MPAATIIGERVIWRGRLYVLVGIDPMSESVRRADLRDLATNRRFRVPTVEVRRLPPDARR
jgi:hypothetical protein